ncbi:MAG TPA: LysR substrate-binding domain-containing protein [Verrucomicrobiae bacterium]
MEIHQLRYFVAVAQEKSFSRAAEKVRVAQPSLSQQIQKLESELGQPLFDRLARQVVLTEAGEAFLPHAQRILNEVSSAQRFLSDRSDSPAGEVRLGILPTIAPFIIQELLAAAAEKLPFVELNFVEDVTERLVHKVEEGEIDLAILSTCRFSASGALEKCAEEPLLAAVPLSHPLAKRGEIIGRDLAKETVLILPESHCLSRQIHKWCLLHRVRDKRIGALQLGTLLAVVAADAGISLIPKIAANALRASSGCAFIPFKAAKPMREINLLRNTLHYRSKACIAVSEIAAETIRKLVGREIGTGGIL